MIAAYVRVSSRGQDVGLQREAIARAAAARGEQIDRWFEEVRSVSRRSNEPRPALEEARAQARRGELARLYVFKLDRLTRLGARDTLAIVEDFRSAGTQLVTVADAGFHLGGPADDMLIAMLGWLAQMERAALGERITAARARIAAKGGAWGRPARVDAETRRKIQELAGKCSTRKIAQVCKVPRTTVRRVLGQKGAYKSAPGDRGKDALSEE